TYDRHDDPFGSGDSAAPVHAELEEHADVGARGFRRRRARTAARRLEPRHLGRLADQAAECHEVADLVAPSARIRVAARAEIETEGDLAARPVEDAALPPHHVLDAEPGLAPEVDAEAVAVAVVRERVAERAAAAQRTALAHQPFIRAVANAVVIDEP